MPIETMTTDSRLVDTSGWADPVLRYTADHDAMEASYKNWSLCDAASFVLMRQLSIAEVFTSDHHFDQASFLRMPRP